MDYLLFLFLGFLDGIAIIALGFKVFRLPVTWFKRELGLIALILTSCSFIVRILIGLPEIDMIVQYSIIVLFFRYHLKVKLFDALMLPAIGYLSFDLVQLIVYPQLISIGLVSIQDIQQNVGYGTFLIQVIGQAMSFLICWLLYRFNLGFSFVACPPHDIEDKFTLQGYDIIMFFGVACSAVVFASILYWLFHYHNQWEFVVSAIAVILGLMLVIAYRKESNDI
ncbi:hypothetical protein [Brevibacillus sp. MER 51]|uniref:hypothetical protein n=1 Tax=Brevibacillus sp. MER 51 TaxID=2939560 RepID=UPI0020411345|nr:hypothetical protein [Brevibacillus sp. MER 51]MCM3144315.1 hypothetical protein [Brevibacillus sp. MER 51]